ncbi:MAG: hypothetical protein U7123_21340 [Potamolinea sp.]
MSLHIFHSTPNPDTAYLRGWQLGGMSVDFLCESRYGSIEEERTAKIGNNFKKDAGNLLAIDPRQLNKRSGRYRRKNAVPT